MTTELSDDCLAIINAGEWKSRESLSMIVQVDGKRFRVPCKCSGMSSFTSFFTAISNPIPGSYLRSKPSHVQVYDDQREVPLALTDEFQVLPGESETTLRLALVISVPIKKSWADFPEEWL